MKNLSVLFLLFSWSIVFVTPLASAQELRGKILDTDNNPIEFATVRVMHLSDTTTTITGTVSDHNGAFSIHIGQNTLPILIKISSVGYNTSRIEVNDTKPLTISLSPKVTMLNEAVVTGKVPKHTLIPGGIRTQIEGSVLASRTDLMQVLKALPLVDIKHDKITIISKGSPTVYVNGRKVQSMMELQRIQPHLIEHIEVLTTPDARYEASAESIILIKVRREAGSGLSGILRSDISRHLTSETEIAPYLLADLNYRVNSWDFMGSISYDKELFIKEMTGDLIGRVAPDSWKNKMDIMSIDRSKTIGTTIGINHSGEGTDVGLKYIHEQLLEKENLIDNNLFSTINTDPAVFHYTKSSTKARPYSSHRMSTYLSQRILTWQLLGDLDYYHSDLENDKHTYESIGTHTGGQSYESKSKVQNTAVGGRLQGSGKLFGGSMSIGIEASHTKRTDIYTPDAKLELPSNNSCIKQSNISAFVSYSRLLNSIGMLSVGVRLEHLKSRYYQDDKVVEGLSRSFIDIFPDLSFATRLWGINLQASINSRIQRPQYWQLSSEYHYISKFEYQKGDPNLLPSLIYSAELTLNRNWVTLYLSNKHLRRDILQRTERMPDPSNPGSYKKFATLINIYNVEPYNQMQAMLILSPQIGPWSPNWIIGTIVQSGLQTDDFERKIKLNKPILYVEMKNDLSLPYDINLGLNAKLMAFGDISYVKTARPSISEDLSLTKEWLGGHLVTSLILQNFLNIVEETWTIPSRYTNFTLTNDYKPKMSFSLKYRFNTTKSKYKGKGALDTEIRRMNK